MDAYFYIALVNNVLEVYFTLGMDSYGKIIFGIQLVPHACRGV